MLNQDFKEFIQFLNDNHVRYLIVGDYAVAIHGYLPNRIDLLTTIDGVNFENCYPLRLEVTVDNIVVNFIDLDNLRKNKEASGRL